MEVTVSPDGDTLDVSEAESEEEFEFLRVKARLGLPSSAGWVSR